MYSFLLIIHSLLRFILIIQLVWVILLSFKAWRQSSQFSKIHDNAGKWLMMSAHLQLVLGLILYGISPLVVFSKTSMQDSISRYWLVEHSLMMVVAIVLITLARILSKKVAEDRLKHRRMFIMNSFALLFIILTVLLSGRNFFSLPL